MNAGVCHRNCTGCPIDHIHPARCDWRIERMGVSNGAALSFGRSARVGIRKENVIAPAGDDSQRVQLLIAFQPRSKSRLGRWSGSASQSARWCPARPNIPSSVIVALAASLTSSDHTSRCSQMSRRYRAKATVICIPSEHETFDRRPSVRFGGERSLAKQVFHRSCDRSLPGRRHWVVLRRHSLRIARDRCALFNVAVRPYQPARQRIDAIQCPISLIDHTIASNRAREN